MHSCNYCSLYVGRHADECDTTVLGTRIEGKVKDLPAFIQLVIPSYFHGIILRSGYRLHMHLLKISLRWDAALWPHTEYCRREGILDSPDCGESSRLLYLRSMESHEAIRLVP